LRYNAAGTTQRDTDVKKRLTIGRAREWMIALVIACIAILVLIGVATWWVA
jgi:CHASE3 domain sensor protein